MLEIRIHGRGGQGNVMAAYLLASAAIDQGRQAQAFPSFGAERRGAPVTAFVRIADRPIRRRCQVQQPDFLIVQDAALLHVPGVTAGLKPGGAILSDGVADAGIEAQLGCPVVWLPATRLALEHLGKPVPNTALMAAFLSLTGILPVTALIKALGGRFKGDLLERNQRLIEAAAAQVPAGLWQEAAHAARA
ncbi:MAG: 2-oxoacid:acceptor oxidoreductase family protein [Pseudomonadota bacterium]